jgi:hypothetical protein
MNRRPRGRRSDEQRLFSSLYFTGSQKATEWAGTPYFGAGGDRLLMKHLFVLLYDLQGGRDPHTCLCKFCFDFEIFRANLILFCALNKAVVLSFNCLTEETKVNLVEK